MMQIHQTGVFIIGNAGIGKSSLALELINHGHRLVADDIVEFQLNNNQLIATAPQMLAGLLHTRELGVIDIKQLFGSEYYVPTQKLDYIVELNIIDTNPIALDPKQQTTLLEHNFPLLRLNIQTPALLTTRLLTWIRAQQLCNDAAATLTQRQNMEMQQSR
jgi:HPr kinase/phosphorylase